MKIYIQDYSWAGMIVVVADNEQEAREIMRNEHSSHYTDKNSVTEHEIVKGFVAVNLGDS